MANVEILGRLLSAGSISSDGYTGGSSVGGQLLGTELASYLSGLSEHEVNYAMAKYFYDKLSGEHLKDHIRYHASSLAHRHGWKIDSNKVSALADLVTDEALSDCRCKCCGGIGRKLNKVCLRCHGTGYYYRSGRQMAVAIGINETALRKGWKDKLVLLRMYLNGFEITICNCIKRNSK